MHLQLAEVYLMFHHFGRHMVQAGQFICSAHFIILGSILTIIISTITMKESRLPMFQLISSFLFLFFFVSYVIAIRNIQHTFFFEKNNDKRSSFKEVGIIFILIKKSHRWINPLRSCHLSLNLTMQKCKNKNAIFGSISENGLSSQSFCD